MLEKRAYASRISDLGENIIRPQSALNSRQLLTGLEESNSQGIFLQNSVSPGQFLLSKEEAWSQVQ